MRFFLIGYMGCGKSTLAEKLASKLKLSFVDLDTEVIGTAGKSIPEIFKTEGESGFRKREKEELSKWLEKDDFVMATGGGTPCYFESMDEMNGCGTTIYLKLTPEELCGRIESEADERPILKGLSHERMIEKVTKQLSKRSRYYDRASMVVEGADIDPDVLGQQLSQLR